jgi:hypothetical protein
MSGIANSQLAFWTSFYTLLFFVEHILHTNLCLNDASAFVADAFLIMSTVAAYDKTLQGIYASLTCYYIIKPLAVAFDNL